MNGNNGNPIVDAVTGAVTGGVNVNQSLMFIPDATCGDIMNVPAIDGAATCSSIQSTSYLCGCPSAQPRCPICGDQSISLGNPMAILNLLDDSVGGEDMAGTGMMMETMPFTCLDFQRLLSLPSTLEFVNFFSAMMMDDPTAITCTDILAQAEQSAGIQLTGYCGCPNAQLTDATQSCKMCPNMPDDEYEEYENDDDGRCELWHRMALFVKDATKCVDLQAKAEDRGCCTQESEPVTPNDQEAEPFNPEAQNGEPSDGGETIIAAEGQSSESVPGTITTEPNGESTTISTTEAEAAAAAASTGTSSFPSFRQTVWWMATAGIVGVVFL